MIRMTTSNISPTSEKPILFKLFSHSSLTRANKINYLNFNSLAQFQDNGLLSNASALTQVNRKLKSKDNLGNLCTPQQVPVLLSHSSRKSATNTVSNQSPRIGRLWLPVPSGQFKAMAKPGVPEMKHSLLPQKTIHQAPPQLTNSQLHYLVLQQLDKAHYAQLGASNVMQLSILLVLTLHPD